MKNKEYKIYSLNCPITKEVRYIGVTTVGLRTRLSQHIWDAKNKENRKCSWIKSVLDNDLVPVVALIEITTCDLWRERERYYVSLYSGKNILLNSTKGGEGVILNRKKCAIKKSTQFKNNPVLQINPETLDIIREFKSSTQASYFFTGNRKKSPIRNIICGRGFIAHGFMWAKKDLFDKEKMFENLASLLKEKHFNIRLFPKYDLFPSKYKEEIIVFLKDATYDTFNRRTKLLKINQDVEKELINDRKLRKVHYKK